MRAAAALAVAALAGCAGAPAVPELLAPREAALAELQARRYQDTRPEEMLPAAVAALQDMGFQLTSSDAALGLVVAQRGYRKEFGEYAREFWHGFAQDMQNFWTLQWNARRSDPAKAAGPAGFNAAVSVAPAGSGSAVRVSFHRFVRRPTGEMVLVWAEELRAPEPYQRFFALLSAALATSSRTPAPVLPAR
jgi:hypothetical protein